MKIIVASIVDFRDLPPRLVVSGISAVAVLSAQAYNHRSIINTDPHRAMCVFNLSTWLAFPITRRDNDHRKWIFGIPGQVEQ